MSRFEFDTVLVSIVLAFAISEILTAWGRLIGHRHQLRAPGLYVRLVHAGVLTLCWAVHAAMIVGLQE